ncbi:MAG: helix-turn-helix domain-containing protein [bacterium]|nr:helix-turn-helix domain-containing protein [bacterium]
MSSKDFISIAELAALLGVSRVAVLKRVRRGGIPALRVGRAYRIARTNIPDILGTAVSHLRRQALEHAAERALREYRETFELLGRE